MAVAVMEIWLFPALPLVGDTEHQPSARLLIASADHASEEVNVTIDEALVADGGELVIFDSKGCAVSKQQFESGQTIVPIYTNRMRGGVYNITFNNGTKTENARIIVR